MTVTIPPSLQVAAALVVDGVNVLLELDEVDVLLVVEETEVDEEDKPIDALNS